MKIHIKSQQEAWKRQQNRRCDLVNDVNSFKILN
jgi:hypothetical protein